MESLPLGERSVLESRILGEPREILVTLPEGYRASGGVYPVLILLDADDSPFYAHDLVTVRYLSHIQRVPELIVVGVRNTDRDRDMLPVKQPGRESGGGADAFLGFLADELKPSLASLRASPYTVLYGASNAGLFAVYALLRRPDAFEAVVAASPMLGWCPDLIRGLAEERLRDPGLRKRLFMVYGGDDYRHVTEHAPAFATLLEEKAPPGFKWALRCHEEEGHVPFTSLYDGLRFAFPRRAIG